MTKRKAKAMPHTLWVAADTSRWIEYLTWDVDPAMPKGEVATRYIRADIADELLAALYNLTAYAAEYLPQTPYNMENATKRILGAAGAAIAKAEGR